MPFIVQFSAVSQHHDNTAQLSVELLLVILWSVSVYGLSISCECVYAQVAIVAESRFVARHSNTRFAPIRFIHFQWIVLLPRWTMIRCLCVFVCSFACYESNWINANCATIARCLVVICDLWLVIHKSLWTPPNSTSRSLVASHTHTQTTRKEWPERHVANRDWSITDNAELPVDFLASSASFKCCCLWYFDLISVRLLACLLSVCLSSINADQLRRHQRPWWWHHCHFCHRICLLDGSWWWSRIINNDT